MGCNVIMTEQYKKITESKEDFVETTKTTVTISKEKQEALESRKTQLQNAIDVVNAKLAVFSK